MSMVAPVIKPSCGWHRRSSSWWARHRQLHRIDVFRRCIRLGGGRERIGRPPFRQSVRIIIDGIFALISALIIVVGIAAGIFTATEASAVSVMYAAFLGFVFYKGSSSKISGLS